METISVNLPQKQRVRKADPYRSSASSTEISLGSTIVEDWNAELVDPRHPALHKRASVNPFDSDVNWVEREKELFQLMHDKLGIGLSAPQVGSSYNMFVMTHSHLGDIGVYKPEILETEGEVVIDEGCLTWPLLYMKIARAERIRVRYYKNDGVTQVETWMDGIDARCFLHEYDHLQGINFIDIVGDLKLKRAKQKRDKLFKKLSKKIK